MSILYRLIPLRVLRRTSGVKFDEIVPSDIPKISGIDRVIHKPNSISPGPIEVNTSGYSTSLIKRPWYMHTGQDDNLMVLQGTRYIDVFNPNTKEKASFIVTPDKVYKNDKIYYDGPAMIVWPAGIFHRIISGNEGSISINISTRTEDFNINNNFNIYNLDTNTGEYEVIKKGIQDQPDLTYKYPNTYIKNLFKDEEFL
tara:strand:+ start:354 stop:950 length:597 start_codon:yes stop_codon:yes gene_type:complete